LRYLAVKFKLYFLFPQVQYIIFQSCPLHSQLHCIKISRALVQGPAYSIVRLGQPKLGPETSNISTKNTPLNTLKNFPTFFVLCGLFWLFDNIEEGYAPHISGTHKKINNMNSCNLLAST
jgi:hypothetical protein